LAWCVTSHAKKKLERKSYSTEIGVDGMPIDSRHPIYQYR
jgi:hypothetical protein